MAAYESVLTSDGVRLAVERQGSGPPLVLVHGSATDRRCFDPILPFLGAYTTASYDRRGHGDSLDSEDYDLGREVDDLAAVVDHVGRGEPVGILAYSFGALITLTALSQRQLPMSAAVLYEPPLGVDGMFPDLDRLTELITQGDHDGALRTFVSTTFHLAERVVDSMRRTPAWEVSVRLVPRLGRELPVVCSIDRVEPEVATPPVRVLVAETGGNPAFRRIAEAITASLSRADMATVPGLPHFAMATEPEAFVAAARELLDRSDRPPLTQSG